MTPNHALVDGGVRSTYKQAGKLKDTVKVGMMSHPMCEFSKARLARTMPTDSMIKLAEVFRKDYNSIRERYLLNIVKKDKASQELAIAAKKKMEALWTFLMGSLSYSKSLGDADLSYKPKKGKTLSSQEAAKKAIKDYGVKDYTRPKGVKYFYDPAQTDVMSKLNIGLFQFVPYKNGNISHCITAWNRDYPQCKIPAYNRKASAEDKKKDIQKMMKIMGGSDQIFNAYCGVSKIAGTFQVQVNATQSWTTSDKNLDKKGKLKKVADLCVTLHIHSGKGYNHFGPLQKGNKGKGIEKLFKKYEAAKKADPNFLKNYIK